jgi:hypothetical protein
MLAEPSPAVAASAVGESGGETTVKPFHVEVNPVAFEVVYTVGRGVGRVPKFAATVGALPKNRMVCSLFVASNARYSSAVRFDGNVMLVNPPD